MVVARQMSTAYDRTETRLRKMANTESTANTYMTDVRNFRDWLASERDRDLFEASAGNVEDYLLEQIGDYANTTVEGRLSALSKWYSNAETLSSREDTDFPDVENPVEGLPSDVIEKVRTNAGTTARDEIIRENLTAGIIYVTKSELNDIVNNVPSPSFMNKCIVLTMAKTGVRRSELANMQPTDFDVSDKWEFGDPWHPDDNSISIPGIKSDDRTVYYPDSLKLLLEEWINQERPALPTAEESPWMWPTRRAVQIDNEYVNDIVSESASRAGIQDTLYTDKNGFERKKIVSHSLRHHYAVYCVRDTEESGSMDIAFLQTLMGHSDIDQTRRYLNFKKDDIRDAARKFGPK